MTEPVVSLMDPEFWNDPVSAYERLRGSGPLIRMGLPGVPPVWLVTSCEHVKSALSDPRFVVDAANVPGHHGPGIVDQMMAASGMPDEFRDYMTNMMFTDGKDHSRLRRLVTPGFSARRIRAMRPRVDQIAGELVESLAEKGSGELIADFSAPLTTTVICELIGVDRADQAQMGAWMRDYTTGERVVSGRAMVNYTRDLIERRRAEPADDMISAMIRSGDEAGDRLSDAEIIAMALLLINAGHHSTAQFIPNAVLVLLDHPEQLARLRAEPGQLPGAMDELMRLANPVPIATPRYATEDMEFAGVAVRRGEALTGSLEAANFDPERFPAPRQLDTGRDLGRGDGHLSFGAGPHYCPGAALARLEGEIALDHLLLRRDSLRLAVERDEVDYVDVSLGLRMLSSLPVRL
ncbi:cytochrome P450 family protein [Salinispora mooreana]|uniref:cytochrome P450 family protein n=1 Tax=Salinispora mooreana TaxID=999545 RepID=UPI0003680A75|nr:cytochrome P450 [Salinispora mooreana]